MSFFDEYPPPSVRLRTDNCCDHLGEHERIDQFLHVLGHSRIPFSVAQLAAITGVDSVDALGAISEALRHQWIGVVEAEEYMDKPTGLYVGRLVKRR